MVLARPLWHEPLYVGSALLCRKLLFVDRRLEVAWS